MAKAFVEAAPEANHLDFECCTFDHSDNSPDGRNYSVIFMLQVLVGTPVA